MKKNIIGLALAGLMFVLMAAGCETTAEENVISLKDNASEINGSGAEIKDNIVTIAKTGVYTLTGTLSDGQIVVNANGPVELVLNNVSVSHNEEPAVYNPNGELKITLEEGSENYFYTLGELKTDDNGNELYDGGVYSEENVIIDGTGSLTIEAEKCSGISSKESIEILDGTLKVNAEEKGIKGKKGFTVEGGTAVVNAGDNGISSSEGDIVINNGCLNISSTGKGIKAENAITVNEGSITVSSEDDALHSNGSMEINGGDYNITTGDDAFHAETELVVNNGNLLINESYEGLEGMVVTLNGGNVNITASDDGINAAGSLEEDESIIDGNENNEKEFDKINEGNDRQQPQSDKMPADGQQPQGNEMPADRQQPQGGEMPPDRQQPQSDEMPADGQQHGVGGMHGGGGNPMADSNENNAITINGGTYIINAQGDGIDSNGHIYFNGGVVIVYGPENGGNGALDTGIDIEYNGGVLLAIGSSGMAESPDGDLSEGYSFIYNGETMESGTRLSIVNEDTKEVLFSTVSPKIFSSVVYGDETLGKDTNIGIYTGGSIIGGNSEENYITGGTLEAGEQTAVFALTDKCTSSGTTTGFGSGFPSGGRGHRGNMNSVNNNEEFFKEFDKYDNK